MENTCKEKEVKKNNSLTICNAMQYNTIGTSSLIIQVLFGWSSQGDRAQYSV